MIRSDSNNLTRYRTYFPQHVLFNMNHVSKQTLQRGKDKHFNQAYVKM